MPKINQIKPIICKGITDRSIDRQTKLYAQAKDTFERTTSVKAVAKDFRTRIIDSYQDWVTGFPGVEDEGYSVVRGTINSLTKYVDNLVQSDAEKFTKYVFGKDQVVAIEDACKKNAEVQVLKDTLEEHLGTTIRKAVHLD